MIKRTLLASCIISASCSPPHPSSIADDFHNKVPETLLVKAPRPHAAGETTSKTTKRRQVTPSTAASEAHTSAQIQSPVQATTPQNRLPLSYQSITTHGITVSAVYYDDREFDLQVADQPNGCGSLWLDAKSAGLSRNAIAAINAGFFTPEGKPLGLLVESGLRRGYINQSSLGSGIYASTPAGPSITRRDNNSSSQRINNATQLLQAGPILIEQGAASSGLSDQRNRPRSFIAWDGHHHWMMGHIETATLMGAAQALAKSESLKFKPSIVLNLDGGRSSDLWAGPQVPGGNRSHRSFLNKAVRNYLLLTPR
ncbi:MAG: phosphodiester glycosidase family protein [Akkermansiaceae bacterium]|nr:phosphodiester glycosidase family protein [Akkermansiaceae bacterium]